MKLNNEEISNYSLSDDEQLALEANLNEVIVYRDIPAKPEWNAIQLNVPQSFMEIYSSTITAYQKVLETDKIFPAIEAIFLEARNSLPNEVLESL